MKPIFTTIACLFAAALSGHGLTPVVPKQQSTHVIAASSETPDNPYLAFPAVLDVGREVLVSFKRGRSHGADSDAALDYLRLDKNSSARLFRGALAALPGEIMQMGEWAIFPNGDIANYIDAQHGNKPPLRSGLCVVRSTDGGRTFGPPQRVGPVEGVEYGYAFDAITRGKTTWMLAMTFANLPGGKLVHKTGSKPGSVDVIRSDDNGLTWRFVRSITTELDNAPINESAFVPYADGFIVAARGYDNRQWLLRTDAQFKALAKTDLTAAHKFITSHIGRPRLFQRDRSYYLLGRNWATKGVMQLALFKFDPVTLAISRHVILDNAEGKPVGDGYYAQPYWQERDGQTRFHVITYKRGESKTSDIIRLQFDWQEVR